MLKEKPLLNLLMQISDSSTRTKIVSIDKNNPERMKAEIKKNLEIAFSKAKEKHAKLHDL